jgi:hypothetical protein
MKNENVLRTENNLWEEIFISLSKIKSLTDHYSNKTYKNNKYPLSKLFYKMTQSNTETKDILREFERIINQLKVKEKILNSSNNLLNFLLYGLHMESKYKNGEENNMINSDSNDKLEYFEKENEAYDYFQSKNNNMTYIQKQFFGIKKINKFCEVCEMNLIAYNHFKFFPLDLRNVDRDTTLKSIIESIYREFKKEMYCKYCKKKKELIINIEIEKLPKYLIFLLYNYKDNDLEIKFLDDDLGDNYKLKSFIIKKEKTKLKKLSKLFKCKNIDNKEYKSFWIEGNHCFSFDNKNGRKNYQIEDIKENPYFIIYKEEIYKGIGKNLNRKIKSAESEERLMSDKPKKISGSIKKSLIKFNNNKNMNKIEEKPIKINNINNIIKNESKNKNKNDDKNDIKKSNKIEKNNDLKKIIKNKIVEKLIVRLYFKYENKSEIYFIDTENTKTFEMIMNELKNTFGLSDFDKIKLRLGDKEINKLKTPKFFGISHGTYIYMLPNS